MLSNRKCTDKEWQHCRVEKMGCKGCYYDIRKISNVKLKIEDINVGNMKPINPIKLKQKKRYFEKYGIFKENIIVDENNKLIDGFSSILIAVEYGIKKVEPKSKK